MKGIKTSTKLINDIYEARDAGMSFNEVSKLVGLPTSTIYSIIARRKVREAKPAVLSGAMPLMSVGNDKSQHTMTLEQFVNLLHSLATDYERTKTELHSLKKQVAEWQGIAGKLNDDIHKSVRG